MCNEMPARFTNGFREIGLIDMLARVLSGVGPIHQNRLTMA